MEHEVASLVGQRVFGIERRRGGHDDLASENVRRLIEGDIQAMNRWAGF
jgi:hypothetical protein